MTFECLVVAVFTQVVSRENPKPIKITSFLRKQKHSTLQYLNHNMTFTVICEAAPIHFFC